MKFRLIQKLKVIILCAAILSVILFSALSARAESFSDIHYDSWAYNDIEVVYSAGITVGCSQNPLNYCPSLNVTRDQMAAFIIRALYGENFSYTLTPYFTDVSPNNYFFKYIQKLKDMNITTMDALYLPGEGVTRGQMAAFLIRALQVRAGQDTENFTYTPTPYFIDVPYTHVLFKYIQKLKDDGITKVTGTYDPEEVVSRDQMAAFIARSFLSNMMHIDVNVGACGNPSYSYLNEPCVSVTVCSPGTSNCQTIDGILLDTGSYGLRIFKQVLSDSLALTQVMDSNELPVAECISYMDDSSDWGPVRIADIILGNEPPVRVPIQIIDQTFGVIPSSCTNPNQSPESAGYNGILGVGPFAQDCPTEYCSNNVNNGWYFSCAGSTCNGTVVDAQNEVQNPVARLPQDNNGLAIQLQAVPFTGALSASGDLILGIGTQANNAPSVVTTYPVDANGDFTTVFSYATYPGSYIDSGSNGIFFPSSGLPSCAGNSGWFCPQSITNLSATNTGAWGTPTGKVSFQIGNFNSLTDNTSNQVFPDIGGDNTVFDWGLPFFFGRTVYLGIEGMESNLGTGPFVAY